MNDNEDFKKRLKEDNARKSLATYDDEQFYSALSDLYNAGRLDAAMTSSDFVMGYAEKLKANGADPSLAAIVACVSVALFCNETGIPFPAETLKAALGTDVIPNRTVN